MLGARFDYTNKRQRHEKFVGREVLLAQLDELLVGDGADRRATQFGVGDRENRQHESPHHHDREHARTTRPAERAW